MLDRDEREETEVKCLSTKLKHEAKLIVLKKRELENYLLSPVAISKFIKLKHQLAGTKEYKSVEIAEITQAIDQCADALKDVAIERRVAKITCLPIYPNRIAVLNSDSKTSLIDRIREDYLHQKQRLDELEKDLSKIIEEQTKLVEENWTSQKLDLVPR